MPNKCPEKILCIYIYIYGRGRRFPERTSIRIIELEKKRCFTVVKWRLFMSFFSLLMSFHYGSFFFVRRSWSQLWTITICFFGVLIFSIGITRCTICAISKIIGKGYNILCFHRYFDVMLFFIGNSQWFCISSEFPSAVSQLFLLSLYKSFSTRHINHYRRHKPDQFKCYSMQEDNVNMNVNIPPHPPTPPHPTPSRKLHERYYTPPHPTPPKLHERYYTPPHPTQVTWTLLHPTPPHPFTQVTWTLLHPTPPHPFPPSGNPRPQGYIYIYILLIIYYIYIMIYPCRMESTSSTSVPQFHQHGGARCGSSE